MDERQRVEAFLAERWPPSDPLTLYRWGSADLGALGKEACLRALLAAQALRPPPTDPHDELALWLAERWVLAPTTAHRRAAARLASMSRRWSGPRTIAHAAGRRTGWVPAIGVMLTGDPRALEPAAFAAMVEAVGRELRAWATGGADPVAARHAVRGPIRPATPHEIAAIDRESYAAWGDPGPAEAFAEREQRLRSGVWPGDTHTTWVLPGLASCETYRMPCTGGTAWGVASVYVAESLRGRGHASTLLTALADRLRTEPDARALVLFSDVGAPIYQRLGFVARPAVDRVWPADPQDPDDGPWRRFGEAELPAVHGALRPVGGAFAIWPSAAQLDWHLDRVRVHRHPRSTRCGAVLGDDAIVWVEHGDELLVLSVTSTAESTTRALMTAAARTAAAVGCVRVRAWDLPLPWPSEAQARPRDGGLPMLLPLRPGVEPEDWTWIPRAVWV